MTLQDYYNAVAESVPTTPTLANQTVYDAINRARRRLAGESDATSYPYTFSLTAGQWNYTYSGLLINGRQVINVRKVWIYIGTMRYEIARVCRLDYPYTNFSGWPVQWWTAQNILYYWPIPDNAYQSDWLCNLMPLNLINTTDVDNDIPFQYQDACTWLACKFTAIADGNINLAQAMEEEYQRTMSVLPRNTL